MSEPSAAWTAIEPSGSEQALAPVHVGAKAHALLGDRDDRALAPPAPIVARRGP